MGLLLARYGTSRCHRCTFQSPG